MHTGAGHQPIMVRSWVALAVAVCAIAPLAACSGGSSDASKASGSDSSSASPTPSAAPPSPTPRPVAEQVPRSPAGTRGQAGEQRFARHVMRLWAYALRTDDAKPLVALGPGSRPCQGCAPFAASLAQRRRHGWSVDFPGLKLHAVKVQTIGDQSNAEARVDIPQSDSYYSDGSYRNTSRAHLGATFQVRMHDTKKGYQLLSFTVA